MALHKGLVGTNRSFRVALFFRGLPDLKELGGIPTHFFVTRRHKLGLFAWLEDDRSHAQFGQSKGGDNEDNKDANSEMHSGGGRVFKLSVPSS